LTCATASSALCRLAISGDVIIRGLRSGRDVCGRGGRFGRGLDSEGDKISGAVRAEVDGSGGNGDVGGGERGGDRGLSAGRDEYAVLVSTTWRDVGLEQLTHGASCILANSEGKYYLRGHILNRSICA